MEHSDLVFQLAVKNLNSNTSARACLADARTQQAAGNLDAALNWALRSIAHSVGILHADYRRAFNASGISGECRLVSATSK